MVASVQAVSVRLPLSFPNGDAMGEEEGVRVACGRYWGRHAAA